MQFCALWLLIITLAHTVHAVEEKRPNHEPIAPGVCSRTAGNESELIQDFLLSLLQKPEFTAGMDIESLRETILRKDISFRAGDPTSPSANLDWDGPLHWNQPQMKPEITFQLSIRMDRNPKLIINKLPLLKARMDAYVWLAQERERFLATWPWPLVRQDGKGIYMRYALIELLIQARSQTRENPNQLNTSARELAFRFMNDSLHKDFIGDHSLQEVLFQKIYMAPRTPVAQKEIHPNLKLQQIKVDLYARLRNITNPFEGLYAIDQAQLTIQPRDMGRLGGVVFQGRLGDQKIAIKIVPTGPEMVQKLAIKKALGDANVATKLVGITDPKQTSLLLKRFFPSWEDGGIQRYGTVTQWIDGQERKKGLDADVDYGKSVNQLWHALQIMNFLGIFANDVDYLRETSGKVTLFDLDGYTMVDPSKRVELENFFLKDVLENIGH